jgi:diguanylate cyclase (GGDEF)-like protein
MSPVRIKVGRGVIGAVFERAQALLVRDVDALRGPSRPRARFRTKSCAAIPVTASGQVLAVLSVADREGDGAFTPADVDRLATLAAPAALALARLRTELRVRDLAQAAIVDSGSGLFNRLYFHSRMQEEVQRATRQGTPLALQIIDVDTFKAVNDQFGHLAGDATIKEVADILRRSVRVFDVCARYGGDEFAVVMPGSRSDSAAAVADRIRTLIEHRQPRLPSAPGITVSIGVAELQPGDTARSVIERADRALYEAKRAGKNRVVAATAIAGSTFRESAVAGTQPASAARTCAGVAKREHLSSTLAAALPSLDT